MKCQKCGATAEKSFTISVTDLGSCRIIVCSVPCYKCKECDETIYTAAVVQRLESIIQTAQRNKQEIVIIEYAQGM